MTSSGPGPLVVVHVTTREQLEAAWAVRLAVFVDEQGVPVEEEIDDADTAATTTHLLLVSPGTGPSGADEVIATGRVLSDPTHPGEVHVGRVAVLAERRSGGVGARLMAELEAVALSRHGVGGSVTVLLSAQESATGFYERLGYVVTGEAYLDAGIRHRDASKVVRAPRTGS
ncbi:GNAT family N-acetyltransferase [Sanguibacter suaedae]|uniref:GNAT family N-acetyltransferase n=1 Tax=Sanguibacter suaedae TaxID=2795737 RepID=A0A934MA73_9MICO|nr:GNAT family N-acetyltransferase [Sanguibacter suaedae]MBI9115453.1 GNAT family N-acetyltransferase [Sanguibacter suaedae]